MSRKKVEKTRAGSPAEVVKLDVHDWYGKLLQRTKAKTTEKDKGVMMIDRIIDIFSLSPSMIEQLRREIREKDAEAWEPTKYPKGQEPVRWTRDEKGRIVSPFRSQSLNK